MTTVNTLPIGPTEAQKLRAYAKALRETESFYLIGNRYSSFVKISKGKLIAMEICSSNEDKWVDVGAILIAGGIAVTGGGREIYPDYGHLTLKWYHNAKRNEAQAKGNA